MVGYRKTVKLLKIQLEDKKSKRKVLLDRARKNHNEKRRLTLEENSSSIRLIRNLKNYERQMDASNPGISVIYEEFKFLDNFDSDIYGTVRNNIKRLNSVDVLSIRTATSAPLRKRPGLHRPFSYVSQVGETALEEDGISIEVSDRSGTSSSGGYSSIESSASGNDEWTDQEEMARGSIQMTRMGGKATKRPNFFLEKDQESSDGSSSEHL